MQIDRPKPAFPLPSNAERIYQGQIFSVYEWDQTMFDGSTQRFERLARTDTVTVIAVTPEQQIVITNEQQPAAAPFISLPGGRIDPGEDPLTAAKRELREEAGYESATWELWYAAQLSSKIDWAVYTFIARFATQVADPTPDAGEQISIRFVDWQEFLQTTSDPQFRNTDIALRLFQAQRHDSTFNQIRAALGIEP